MDALKNLKQVKERLLLDSGVRAEYDLLQNNTARPAATGVGFLLAGLKNNA